MSKTSEAQEAIMKYLTLQNRPYSINDITQNLPKEFPKTTVQKALDELSKTGQVKEKVYGKQKIYAPVQQGDDLENMNELLEQLDIKIMETKAELEKTELELKTAENELKEFSNQTSTEDAKKLEQELSIEVSKFKAKLEGLQSMDVKIDPEEKAKLVKEKEKLSREYRKRKRICMEIIDTILENYPKSKKAFFEEVGMETDENCSL